MSIVQLSDLTNHSRLKVGAVSYLNTKPLIYGFEQGSMQTQLNLHLKYPALIAGELIQQKIDIGLVPVAIIPRLPYHQIISDYAIACDGAVASVCLFSKVSIDKIKTIYLDYQSKTSVALLKILLKEYWQVSPQLVDAQPGFENSVADDVAALVIGDRAFECIANNPFIYDLGEAWKNHTGLPFVFATWISNRPIEKDFSAAFNEANALGLANLDKVVAANPYPYYDLQTYYTQNIKFKPDFDMLEVITLFLNKIRSNA